MDVKSLFCDNPEILRKISGTIAQYILGPETQLKINIRYEDLKSNFNAVTYDEWNADSEYPLWRFSSGLTPYMDYDDTSVVPIPISNDMFRVEEAVLSFDFPVWFNLADLNAPRIMFLTQDPVARDMKWYKNCRDALCSTVFGLHNPLWRNKGNAGKRIWLLVNKLIENGYASYFTDCNKVAIQSINGEILIPDPSQISAYQEMINKEIEIVKPNLIVAFGRTAEEMTASLTLHNVPLLHLPHFSGQAQGKIKSFFDWPDGKQFDINAQADCYFNTIIKYIQG